MITTQATNQPLKSQGHVTFCGLGTRSAFELFIRTDDSGKELVFRAPIGNIVMPDGFRSGRFECPVHMIDSRKAHYERVFSINS